MRFIIILFLAIISYSKTIEAIYSANYGLFNDVLTIKNILKTDNKNYTISSIIETKGIISKLTHNLTIEYKSKGVIEDNIFIPKKFIFHRKTNKDVIIIYNFDYDKKSIFKMKFINGEKIYNKKLNFFSNDDILTLYFNSRYYLKAEGHYTFYAVEGGKNGKIDIDVISLNPTKLKVNLHDKAFLGGNGIVYLSINNNWIVTKATMKKILKIGDLKGELKYLKIEK